MAGLHILKVYQDIVRRKKSAKIAAIHSNSTTLTLSVSPKLKIYYIPNPKPKLVQFAGTLYYFVFYFDRECIICLSLCLLLILLSRSVIIAVCQLLH